METELEWIDSINPSHESLFDRFDKAFKRSRSRIESDRFMVSLFSNRSYQGFDDGVSTEAMLRELADGGPAENVIARIVTTLAAKLAKQRTLPMALVEMGDWGLQQRSDMYRRFVHGALHDCAFFEKQRLSDMHMLITGHGGLMPYIVGSERPRIKIDVVPPWQRVVELADSRTMSPRIQYRRLLIDKRTLKQMYPEKKAEIDKVEFATTSDTFDVCGDELEERVEVVTGWYLPYSEESNDGVVEVACRGCTLSKARWDHHRFPIADSRYMIPPDGFWGIGVVSLLVSLQGELNKTSQSKMRALDLLSAPFIAIERGSNIVKSYLSNAIGRIIEYTGTPPTIVAPNPISQQLLSHAEEIRSSMFQTTGVSELSAMSMKPAGLNSGKALRVYSDMLDAAFTDVMLRRDEQVLATCESILDAIERYCEETGKDYRAKYVGPFEFERIPFKELQNDRDSIHLKMTSASALASTLAGRIEDVNEISNAGVPLDSYEKERLLNIPDLAESSERRYSMLNLLRKLVEDMLLHGKWVTPEPRWDLETALDVVSSAILRAQVHGAPEDRMDLLRRFELECMALVQQSLEPEGVTQSQSVLLPETQQVSGGMIPGSDMAQSPGAAGVMPAGAM